jgi:hypothetical protein
MDGVWTSNESGTTTERSVYDHGRLVSGDVVDGDASGFYPDGYVGVAECKIDILERDWLPAN